jgi:hypothetical protein
VGIAHCSAASARDFSSRDSIQFLDSIHGAAFPAAGHAF